MKQKSKRLSLLILPILLILAAVISTSGLVVAADMVQPGNTSNDSFSKSKKLLHKVIYNDAASRQDIYCGCQYDEKKEVDFASCGYAPQKDNKRAHRIEWEHVVPAEAFGQSFPEWRNGHPDCVDNRGRSFKGRNANRRPFSPPRISLPRRSPSLGPLKICSGLLMTWRIKALA